MDEPSMPPELRKHFLEVALNKTFRGDDLPDELIDDLARAPLIAESEIERYVHSAQLSFKSNLELSPAEERILNLICEGKQDRQIAEELFLTYHTVRQHVQRIYVKMKVHNRAQAAALWQRKLLE